jgi:hypothetical protein
MKNEKPVLEEYGKYKIVFEGMMKENSEMETLLPTALSQEIEEIEELRRFSSELKKESGFFYSSTT